MARKLLSAILVAALSVPLSTAGVFAAGNKVPTVTAFEVAANSASPVPVPTFTATDIDGTVTGYLITESSVKPAATAPGWRATAPKEYATVSTGTVTLYAWAKDNANAVSTTLKSATVIIPDPVSQRLAALELQVVALQNLLQHFSRDGDEVVIAGANLRIVSGSGATNGPVNGLGNLIVGYNELRNGNDDRSGSHNIVAGSQNNYTSFGGLVIGLGNEISGEHAVVAGGFANTASGLTSVVSGGVHNTATGWNSSVCGGYMNTASGQNSSVSGGGGNLASGGDASISGGGNNVASGIQSSVSGGYGNVAGYYNTSVSGGSGNAANGHFSSVSGGGENSANYWNASICGGYQNTAGGRYTSIGGGSNRSVFGDFDWQAGGLFQDQ